MTGLAAGRRAAVPAAVFLALLLVYGSTLARDVTFWDAGEFIAAASSFGIPHPPGTPLYVMLLRVAILAVGPIGMPAAVATSLVSAACTAGACAAGAALLHRATREPLAAVAGGVAAGTMATVWLNATETEVYAASLALSVAIVWAAERAGRRESFRWGVVTAYLLALAVPLHLSALLVAPAAVYLAAGGTSWPRDRGGVTRAIVVAAGCSAAFALGRMTLVPSVIAALAISAAGWLAVTYPSPSGSALRRERRMLPPPPVRALLPLLGVAVAASALLVLLLRAAHDPGVNQGNPSTLAALVDVVARQQYDVAGLWPRQAPLWLQVANVGLYADWQVARSLGPTIFPTPLRTGATLLFVLLGGFGARTHWRRDRRSAAAFGLLLLAGTLGAALYLNLKAGPSFGHGILPHDTLREARERDYFFVIGWWAWGAWAGLGAVMVARRAGIPPAVGLLAALMPAMLNWQAVDRTRQPDASLARATAEGLLSYLPARAVLFVAGDNDTYPLWYAQQTLGIRTDVTVVTVPLLPADWYRLELERRHGLLAGDTSGVLPWRGRVATMVNIADHARRAGRPVAMAVSVPAGDRNAVRTTWTLVGPAYVARDSGIQRLHDAPFSRLGGAVGMPLLAVDTTVAADWAVRFAARTDGRAPRPAMDGAAHYMDGLLRCPEIALDAVRNGAIHARADSLAPLCNFR